MSEKPAGGAFRLDACRIAGILTVICGLCQVC
jgi:hypothetical protein